MRIVIRHESWDGGQQFVVQRVDLAGVRAAARVSVSDPLSQVLGETTFTLGAELSWYLEHYLDYPFGPNVARAERVTMALKAWGRSAFESLFGEGRARDFYRDATRDGHAALHLVIASDSAQVMAWPWEALHDPAVGDLAQHCRTERQLDAINDPPEVDARLSRDQINILLVTARPYRDDVAYRSISRPLVELLHRRHLPATVKVLRPPTFAQLRAELQAQPGGYHIVHFDGHGGFGPVTGRAGQRFDGPQGQLVFEDEDGSEAAVTGEQLSQLLREYRIPIAVLNACQSGMLGTGAEDAFASVATSLLRAGVRSVVAMGYSLYVSAAQEFLPAFYARLFASGSVAEATRAGRQALLASPERRPGFELRDWLVPVLYQQAPLALDFAVQAARSVPPSVEGVLPAVAQLNTGETPHGLMGRDSAVLALERASRRAPAGLLVHGLGGVGKTTLARGYLEWLAQTQGLPERVLWLSFTEVRSASYVLNRLVESVLGTDAMAAPEADKWPALRRVLREHALLIVWDNFESASGAADAGLDTAMSGGERQQLKQWLEDLRGGKTKVLITSRSDEAWLGATACYRVALGGLQGEERQVYAQAIMNDLGLTLDSQDQHVADLIEALAGHPLMMRAILPKLGTAGAESLLRALETYVPELDSGDPIERKLYATLRYVEEGLPDALKPLLYPIGLHEGHVDADWLAGMATQAQAPFTESDTEQALGLLEVAGLVQGIGQSIFRLHPALTRYLRGRGATLPLEVQARWKMGFVEVMATVADGIASRAAH